MDFFEGSEGFQEVHWGHLFVLLQHVRGEGYLAEGLESKNMFLGYTST